MADSAILLDTSVLIHATFSDLPCHDAIWVELDRARKGAGNYCVCVHSLAELAWIASDPVLVRAPDTPELVRRKLEEFLGARFLGKLPIGPATVLRQAELIERCALVGPRTADALIVAAMLEHGVPRLHTLHPQDFAVFTEIRAVNPYL